jgi:hypothetical protein
MSVFIQTLRYLAVARDDCTVQATDHEIIPHGRVGVSGAVRVTADYKSGATGLIGRSDRLFCCYTRI